MAEKSGPVLDLLGDPWSPPRDPRGRKRHRVTPQGRENVAQLKGAGASDDDIALQLGLSLPTLRKYYFRELSHGRSLARNEIVQALYAKAKAGNVTAMKAYLAETSKTEAAEVAYRAPSASAAKPGKKEERQAAAEEVGGIFAPGAPPASLTH
jgi:hypothetical protein